MPNLATWMRAKNEPAFRRSFAPHPEIEIRNAAVGPVNLAEADGLLLTGGPDVSPEFLRQEIPDPSVLDKDVDPVRDAWEFQALKKHSSVSFRSSPFAKACSFSTSRSAALCVSILPATMLRR